MIEDIKLTLNKIRQQRSIVLNYTNYVTMDFMANVLSVIGASPIMSCSYKEVGEMVKIANGLNINIGTFDNNYEKTVKKALKVNKNYKKVCVLDPTGAPASAKRKQLALLYLKHANIIKGNASEILALQNSNVKSHGIDSTEETQNINNQVQTLAQQHNKVFIATGKQDLIVSNQKQQCLNFGSSVMPKVIGTGCALGAVICAFATVEKNYHKASVLAVAFYSLVGQYTALNTKQAGSFKVDFLNNLENPNFEFMQQQLKEVKLWNKKHLQ